MWGDSGNLLLRLSHNQEEVAAYNEAVEKNEKGTGKNRKNKAGGKKNGK